MNQKSLFVKFNNDFLAEDISKFNSFEMLDHLSFFFSLNNEENAQGWYTCK